MQDFIKKILIFALFGVVVFLVLGYIIPLFLPFILGGVVAVLLRPLARRIQHITRMCYRPSAVVSMILFYGVFLLLVINLGYLLFAQTISLFSNLPQLYTGTIQPAIDAVQVWFEKTILYIFPSSNNVFSTIALTLEALTKEAILSISAAILHTTTQFVKALPSALFAFSLVIISSIFMLLDYDVIAGFVKRFFSRNTGKLIVKSKTFVITTGVNLLKAYFLLMLLTFLEVTAGLWLLRIDYFLVIGIIVAVVDILPILGSGAVLVPWGLFLLFTGQGPRGIGILLLYGVVTVVRTIAEPKLIGAKIGLPPIVTIIAMYCGVKLGGFTGLIFAPIAVTLFVYLYKENIKERGKSP